VYTGKIFYFCFQKMMKKEFSWLCLVIHRDKTGNSFLSAANECPGKGGFRGQFLANFSS